MPPGGKGFKAAHPSGACATRTGLHTLRFILRVIPVIALLLQGLLTVMLIFPLLPVRWRSIAIHLWSRVLMACCGVSVRPLGLPVSGGSVLWVANHVSWIDIFCLNSVRPTAFVAKSDIRAWPVIGWLVAGAGTVFIERGNRQAIRLVGDQMRTRFARNEVVGLFPEGTTSNGFDVAPFHASLFEAAIRSGVDVQPVALRFYHRGVRSDYVAFTGEQTLVANMWCLLGTTGVRVELDFLEPLRAEQCLDLGRAKVAESTHRAIQLAVRQDTDDAQGQSPDR